MSLERSVFLGTLGVVGVAAAASWVQPVLEDAWRQDETGPVRAAIVGVLGTLVAGVGALSLWQLQHWAAVRRDRQAAERRQLRMLLALRAELIRNLEDHAAFFVDGGELKSRLIGHARTARDGEPSMPIATATRSNDAFDHARPHLSELPAPVISELIECYRLDEHIAVLLSDFTAGRYERISLKRKESAIAQLFDLGAQAADAALEAIDELELAIRDHPARHLPGMGDIRLARKQIEVLETWRPRLRPAQGADAAGGGGSDDHDGRADKHV
jgi:hypothetical protein